MRIFVAGATGALGERLVPMLVSAGHHVVGMTRTETKTGELRAAGAEPVVADALDRKQVMDRVIACRPDVVVHELTAIARMPNLKKWDREFAPTNRLRTAGTDILLAAARAAGAQRFVAQSFAGWPFERTGGQVKSEEAPLDPNPPDAMKQTLDAIRRLEQTVSSAPNLNSLVLRYGGFYGPGTSVSADGDATRMVRKRQFPIFGAGTGVWSFLHIDDAANATRLAIEGGPAGIYNIVDDEPAEVSVWLPEFARAIRAKPPYRLPEWLGRLLIGEAGLSVMNQVRGASNAKAKRLLGWSPTYATWRDGFRRGLSAQPPNPVSQPATF